MFLKSQKVKAQQVLTFRKWGRKNYSVFLTLHRVVKISVLAVVYFVSAPAVTVAMEKDTTEVKMQYDLDEIEVSAQRAPALYSQVARIVSVVERKQIESAPAHSVAELLEYIAGVDVRQRGTDGVQADISIRGGTFDQLLILLNGINITDPQTGHHNLNLPVSLSQIERIEILEGPAARVYGPNAFSGAVNIVTRAPQSNQIILEAGTGSFGYFSSTLSGAWKTGKMNHLVATERKKSDGYMDNTDFGMSNFYYSNFLNSQKGKFAFQAGHSGKEFGANSFYTPKYPNQFEHTQTFFSSAKWESAGKFHLTPVVYYRRHFDRFELFRENPPAWYTTHNYHQTNVYGANVNSWVQWKFGKTSFGTEFRSENILSNVLGVEMNEPVKVPGENAFYTRSKSRNTTSFFLEQVYYYRNWIISGGLLANHISGSNRGWNFFPGMEVSHRLSPEFKVFGSYNTSLRMPTFTDLYYAGPTNVGNPELKPEKSAALEAGFRWSSSFIQVQGVIFHRQGKDMIDWVKTYHEELWKPQNLTRINSLGSEMQVEMNLKKQFGNHFPNRVSISFFHNRLEKQNETIISNYVLDHLKNKITGSVHQSVLKNLTLELKFVFQDREGTFTQFSSGNQGNEVNYSPFWMFDSKMVYSRQKWDVYLSVNNLFDVSYYDIGNVAQPGRWLKAGFLYRLDFN